MKISAINSNYDLFEGSELQNQSTIKNIHAEEDFSSWGMTLIEKYLGGILVFTDQNQLIYANNSAHKILHQLYQTESLSGLIPKEILHICQSLIQSKNLFPDQNWLTEFNIFTGTATTLHICSRWLNIEDIDQPCLLLTLEDRQKAITNIYLNKAERYGLTSREKDVWLLQHKGYTYKQISAELGITPNTVKKHVRSIHVKTEGSPEGSTSSFS